MKVSNRAVVVILFQQVLLGLDQPGYESVSPKYDKIVWI